MIEAIQKLLLNIEDYPTIHTETCTIVCSNNTNILIHRSGYKLVKWIKLKECFLMAGVEYPFPKTEDEIFNFSIISGIGEAELLWFEYLVRFLDNINTKKRNAKQHDIFEPDDDCRSYGI